MEYKRIFGIDTVGENGYTLENGKAHSYPKHCHIFYELLLYLPFDGNITVNEKDFRFKKPTAVLITPSVFHSVNVESGFVTYKKIIFGGDAVKKEILKYIEDPLFYTDVDPLFSLLVDRLFAVGNNREFVLQFINTLLIEMAEKGTPIKHELPKGNIKLITDAINIINSEFMMPLSLETVARRLNVSKQYLSSKFTEVVEKTFTEYLNNIRLRYAATLLSETDLSVSEICYRCGYNNFSYFLRSFKKQFGVSPRKFVQSK